MRTLILWMVLLLSPMIAHANTLAAASCSEADVDSAITAAAAGDTVTIPAGTCAWSSRYILSKTINLTGAGKDSTIITDATASGVDGLIYVTATGAFELSNFSMVGIKSNAIRIGTGTSFKSTGWKIHDMNISSAGPGGTDGIMPWGMTYGVIYNMTFTDSNVDVTGGADADWSADSSLGTANAVYIEDSVFTRTTNDLKNAIDANNGGRYVVRHNSFINTHVYSHTLGTNRRATRHWEIYDNDFYAPIAQWVWISMEAGTGVIYNNRIHPGFSETGVSLQYQRTCGTPGAVTPWTSACTGCTGTCSYDGNTSGKQGYPCRDQIGRSTDTGISTAQLLDPAYQWNNTRCSNTTGTTCSSPVTLKFGFLNSCARTAIHNVENVDYVNGVAKPGYSAYAYPHPLRAETVRKLPAPTNLR